MAFETELKKLHAEYDEKKAAIDETSKALSDARNAERILVDEYNYAAQDLSRAKSDLPALPQALHALTAERDTTRAQRDEAKSKLAQLERAAGVGGTDPSQAVRVPAEDGGKLGRSAGSSPADKWAEYVVLREKEQAGTVPHGTAHKFWLENRSDLSRHAAIQRRHE